MNFIKVQNLILEGAEVLDPANVIIKGDLIIGKNVFIGHSVVFRGEVRLSNGVKIENNCELNNCNVGAKTIIKSNSIIDDCDIGKESSVGPYSRIRPKTIIGDYSQIGNFVEVKNSTLDSGCKINHLTYIGDSTIGKNVIIGAGSVTCNYDGLRTHQTIIENNAFIGSGVFLVAPIRVGESATIGTGSVVTQNVPSKKLTIARSRQITVENWRGPKINEKKEE